MTPFSTALRTITSAFDNLGINYLIGGSLASSARGVLRATIDVDVLAQFSEEKSEVFVKTLGPEWYADAKMIRQSIRNGRSFNVIYRPSGEKFDLFPATTEFHASELRRATLVRLVEGVPPVRFATAEDILLAKLDWYRAGGETSDRQWSDILGILAANPSLDLVYARNWAQQLGVDYLLARALAEPK